MPKAYIIHDSGYHIGDISPVPGGTDIIEKNHLCQLTKVIFFMELLGRFELPTSSLPRMRSTY